MLHMYNFEILEVVNIEECFSKLVSVPLMLWFDYEELHSPLTIKAMNPTIVGTIIQYLGFHSCCCNIKLRMHDRIASTILNKEVLLYFHITYLGFYSRACTIKVASFISWCPHHSTMININ